MLYDLHTHTKASDGKLSPKDLIDEAVKLKLPGIAITDHDTVSGLHEAMDYQIHVKNQIEVIPGIEMNTEMDGSEVHILGYYIDHFNSHLCERLQELKESRLKRAKMMVKKLKAMGYRITFEQVQQLAENDLIARPHIAQVLVHNNSIFSVKEAFEKLIGRGRPAYVPRYKFFPQEAVDLIKSAKGIPVLAHPGLINKQEIIEEIVAMGIEGIEVYYPEHSSKQIEKYKNLAVNNNLLITGGSDYHGPGMKVITCNLGSVGITPDLMKEIKIFYNKNR
ncbi:MAG: PHP domain-containing protein [Syntrophomonadaceae bacterium]|nr:PHP domain-containing protein [Syntrophomonadaceae bacterium]